jgi:hypothetical protein
MVVQQRALGCVSQFCTRFEDARIPSFRKLLDKEDACIVTLAAPLIVCLERLQMVRKLITKTCSLVIEEKRGVLRVRKRVQEPEGLKE